MRHILRTRILLLSALLLAAFLQASRAAYAAEPRPVPVRIDVPADSEHYPAAVRAAAMLPTVFARINDRYPGLTRIARRRGYTVLITLDLPDGVMGAHVWPARAIKLHPDTGKSPRVLSWVFAHEAGHALSRNMPMPARQAAETEYAAELARGMKAMEFEEMIADLTARIATGRLVGYMPETQRYIRGVICE